MYNSIFELPSEVVSSLDADDQEVWMNAYNEIDPQTEEEIIEAKKEAWRACKTLPSSFSFEILASVEDVDCDGELITLDTLKSEMDKYIRHGGTVQSEHSNYAVGTVWDWESVDDPESGLPGVKVYGNVYGGSGENDEYTQMRQAFKDGMNSMSIAGDASIEGYECDDDKCFVRRNLNTLMEISLCSVPANPHSKLQWYNEGAIVKSEPGTTNMKVSDVQIHKSYESCDYELIRKAIMKSGLGRSSKMAVKADGCHIVAKDGLGMTDFLDSIGAMYSWNDGEFVAKMMKTEMKKQFMQSFKDGEIDSQGNIMKMDQERFSRLFEDGLIVKDGTWKFDASVMKDEGAMVAGTEGMSRASYGGKKKKEKKNISMREFMDWKKSGNTKKAKVRKDSTEQVENIGHKVREYLENYINENGLGFDSDRDSGVLVTENPVMRGEKGYMVKRVYVENPYRMDVACFDITADQYDGEGFFFYTGVCTPSDYSATRSTDMGYSDSLRDFVEDVLPRVL